MKVWFPSPNKRWSQKLMADYAGLAETHGIAGAYVVPTSAVPAHVVPLQGATPSVHSPSVRTNKQTGYFMKVDVWPSWLELIGGHLCIFL